MQITMSGEKNDNILRCFKKPPEWRVTIRFIAFNLCKCFIL